MSGTDRTKTGLDLDGPAIILVEPQLGENIGMAARAMGNFALDRLRIVNPRDGWPNVAAQRAAAGADHILERAELFDTVEQAVADLDLLFATTARAHDQAKPVMGPQAAAQEIAGHAAGGGGAGILFGRERWGLTNEEVARANRIITFPVNPGFASLNLAQAVLLMGYEWFKQATAGELPFAMPERSERASQHQMDAFFENLVRELDRVEFLRPAEKRDTMLVNLRNIFLRMEPTRQDMHTLHGVVMAIAEGRKGPAKGGVLDGAQATRLRALLAEHGQGGHAFAALAITGALHHAALGVDPLHGGDAVELARALVRVHLEFEPGDIVLGCARRVGDHFGGDAAAVKQLPARARAVLAHHLAVGGERRLRRDEGPGQLAVGAGLALVELQAHGMDREHRGFSGCGDRPGQRLVISHGGEGRR